MENDDGTERNSPEDSEGSSQKPIVTKEDCPERLVTASLPLCYICCMINFLDHCCTCYSP